MQPLTSYLTTDGWKNDLEQTVDHLVDSGCSAKRLLRGAVVCQVGGGAILGWINGFISTFTFHCLTSDFDLIKSMIFFAIFFLERLFR